MTEYVLPGKDARAPAVRETGANDGAIASFGPDVDAGASLVRVAGYSDIVEAQFAAGWLSGNDIPCFLTNVNLASSVFGALFESLRIDLLVPEDRLDDANVLLSVLNAGGNLSLAELEPTMSEE